MKTNIAFLAAGTAGLALSNVLEAPVYTLDSISLPSKARLELPSLDPKNARLLLAHRLGLSQYHSLKDADDQTLALINNLGGKQEILFDQDERDDEVQRVLVVVEGIKAPKDLFDHEFSPAFTISNSPSSSSNLQLLTDFLSQDQQRRGLTSRCPIDVYTSAFINGGYSGNGPHGTCLLQKNKVVDIKGEGPISELEDLLRNIRLELLSNHNGLQGSTIILHISTFEAINRQPSFDPKRYSEAIDSMKSMLKGLVLQNKMQESTIVLMPPMSSNIKRSENSYGSYKLPAASPMVREQQEEEPLSMIAIPEISSSSSEAARPTQSLLSNASLSPKTTLPICHSSQELCVKTTNSCSGHGTCFRKYTDSDSSAGSDCWSCGCVPSVQINAKGNKKTTYWGGPACQKKDISMPFFLLAGFTVVMVATVSWGIGLLYSIGQEDLPSVIGAGVTGPRAQK